MQYRGRAAQLEGHKRVYLEQETEYVHGHTHLWWTHRDAEWMGLRTPLASGFASYMLRAMWLEQASITATNSGLQVMVVAEAHSHQLSPHSHNH